MTIDELCHWMGEVGATDLHLKHGRPPLVRVDGALRPFDLPPLSGAVIESLLLPIMTVELSERFARTGEARFSHSLSGRAWFRVDVFRAGGEAGAVLRRIPVEIPTLSSLGLPEELSRFAHADGGLVIFSGPAGSGKSTTMCAVLEHINQHRPVHIVTVEDPIKYVFSDKVAAVTQHEVGIDVSSRTDALRAALRQDPDVVAMGWLRNWEALRYALDAAENGYLIFAQMYAASATHALERLAGMPPPEFGDAARRQLAELLIGVVCQRLPSREGGGRVAAVEILSVNETVRQLIDAGKWGNLEQAIEDGAYCGMRTLNQSLAELVSAGVVSRDIALVASEQPGVLELILKTRTTRRVGDEDAVAERDGF